MKTLLLLLLSSLANADVVDVRREQGRDPAALQGSFGTGWFTFTGVTTNTSDGHTAFEYKTTYDDTPTWLTLQPGPLTPAPINWSALTYLDAWKWVTDQPVPPQYVDHVPVPQGPPVTLPTWVAPVVEPYCPPGAPVPEVPEPATMGLTGLGLAGVAYKLKRRKAQ